MLLNCRTNVSAWSYCQLLFFFFFNCFVAAVPWTVNKVVYINIAIRFLLLLLLSMRTPLERCCVDNMSPFVSSSCLSPGSREAKVQKAKICLNCTEPSVGLPAGRFQSGGTCRIHGEKSLRILCLFVSTEYTNLTVRRKNGQTPRNDIARVYAWHRAAKNCRNFTINYVVYK